MPPEDNPADDISEEEYLRGLAEGLGTCSNCGKAMHPGEIEDNDTMCDDCVASEEVE